jgi:hypothetical protein
MLTVNRVAIEALDGAGRAVAIDVSITYDSVEVWAGDWRCAVFDRALLRAWLALPYGFLVIGDITWGSTETGVAITVDHLVPWWDLSPADLERLRHWI